MSVDVDVQDLRCTKLEQLVLTVLVDTFVMTASVRSLPFNKFITIILSCGEINNQAIRLPLFYEVIRLMSKTIQRKKTVRSLKPDTNFVLHLCTGKIGATFDEESVLILPSLTNSGVPNRILTSSPGLSLRVSPKSIIFI